jgi:hypothetical protein
MVMGSYCHNALSPRAHANFMNVGKFMIMHAEEGSARGMLVSASSTAQVSDLRQVWRHFLL